MKMGLPGIPKNGVSGLVLCLVFWLPFSASNVFSDQSDIMYINSYHAECPWSVAEYSAFIKNIPQGTEVIQLYMHSHAAGEAVLEATALVVLKQLEKIKPLVIVAADDNAPKYVFRPYLKDTVIPVIFLGVNVDTSVHGISLC